MHIFEVDNLTAGVNSLKIVHQTGLKMGFHVKLKTPYEKIWTQSFKKLILQVVLNQTNLECMI